MKRILRLLAAVVLLGHCALSHSTPPDYKQLLATVESGEVAGLRQELDRVNVDQLSYAAKVSMMLTALTKRNADVLSTLLDWGMSPNMLLAYDYQGERTQLSPLLFAISARADTSIVDLLLRRGGNVNPRGFAFLPLNFAISLRQFENANRLLDAGALVNQFDSAALMTPLIELVFSLDRSGDPQGMALMKQLIAKGANVNAKGKTGMTALYAAVSLRKVEVVKALLDAKANPNLTNKKGETPLQLATSKGFEDVAELLRGHGAKS
jgi:ankyrin repeat protein